MCTCLQEMHVHTVRWDMRVNLSFMATSAPWRRKSKFIPFQIIPPCDFHKHLPTTCPSLGFRPLISSGLQDRGSTLRRGLCLGWRGGCQPGSAPLSSYRWGSFTHSSPQAVSPSQGQVALPRPLPPLPKPAQPAWQPSISQRCLQCPS